MLRIILCIILLSLIPSVYALESTSHGTLDFSSGIFDVPEKAKQDSIVKRYLVFGTGHAPEDSPYRMSAHDGFFSVGLYSKADVLQMRADGYFVIEDYALEYDMPRIANITGSDIVQSKYDYTGADVTIAIVDTGVDFSNPDIRDSLARDEINHPIMLDSDGQGIILTNTTFYATIDNGIIRNTKNLPDDATSSVYLSGDGVFLDIVQDGSGTDIPVYNSFFPMFGDGPVFNVTLTDDMKIGINSQEFIMSESGYYHLGIMYQGSLDGAFPRLQVVPVLVVDSNEPGVYDVVIADMSTSWEDYTRDELQANIKPDYDFDFTDEKPVILGSGNEFLVYDSDDDGRIDYSAGAVGARVVDVYGVMQNKTSDVKDDAPTVNGTLLFAIDPDGNYFGAMTDFHGHGTSSSASIVSQGKNGYDIYGDGVQHSIMGAATGAQILPVKALWFGDVVRAWLWTSGFDIDQVWEFSGSTRADIISNSWSVSNFPSMGSAPGLDMLSLVLGALATPHSLHDNYPGVTMVVSAGNGGPGYGTIGMPATSPFAISVGATTNNVYVGYGPFAEQPRFGNTTDHFGHVVDFSSRGPGIIGDPKPDIMSIGAYGFVPSSMLKLDKNSHDESFTLFGGTSMAAPLVAAGAAVLIEGLRDNHIAYDPFLIKNILMSSATDIQNDVFTQGSGSLNITNAINYVKGDGVFLVHNDASYKNINDVIAGAMGKINSTSLYLQEFALPDENFEMTSWFGGHLPAGSHSTATFTVQNPTDEELTVSVSAQNLELIKQSEYSDTTQVLLQDRILNENGTYRPNYIELANARNFTHFDSYFEKASPIPDDADLLVLNLHFTFDQFLNKTHEIYAEELQISSLYLYDWIDANNDTYVTSDELSMVSRGGSWGTVQELRISDPATRFQGTPLIGVYPVPTKFSYWIGELQTESAPMNYTLTSSYYKHNDWSPIWLDKKSVTVMPDSSDQVTATIVTPSDSNTGVYQGFLKFSSPLHEASVPVSFVVVHNVVEDSNVLITGQDSDQTLHSPGFVKGSFDMVNRYMAGDWRQYYFDVQDPSLNTAAIEISWKNEDTNLAVFAIDPDGQIIQTNMPSGVFGHFLDWPSLDWLGVSPFSEGGGFYPVKNKDDTSTVLYMQINQTGTYSLMVHSTLFAGATLTEPITLAAKFTTVSRDDTAPVIEVSIPDVVNADSVISPIITDNNLDRVYFFANDIPVFLNNGVLDLEDIPDGDYILTISALDKGKNYSVKTFPFTKHTISADAKNDADPAP